MNSTRCLFNFILFFCLASQSSLLFAEKNLSHIEPNLSNDTGNIHLIISNLSKQTTGFIVSIYRTKENFLKQAEEVYFFSMPELINNELILKNIAFGEFAIAVTADQNNNQVLDTKIFGIPNEPVGFANNPKTRFGPPRFKDSVITHFKPEQTFNVSLVDI